MEYSPAKSGLLLLLAMHLLLCPGYSQRNSHRKDELIQDTVRKFLGVKSTDERPTASGKAQSSPPRYMMNLYEKYRSGQAPMQGNTVRSILAMRDVIADADMLIFNLTGLKSTEQILQSKLYLLKRRKPKGGKKREHSSFRLNVGCLPNMTSMHHIDISLARQKPEWHSYDISESVVYCRQTRKGKDSLLGLTLEVKRSKGHHRLVAFKRIIKLNSQPFVLIFSEDSQNQTNTPASTRHDKFSDLLRSRANEEALLLDGSQLPQTHSRNHRHRGRRSPSEYKNNEVEESLALEQNRQFLMSLKSDEYIKKYFKAAIQKFDKIAPSNFASVLRTVIDDVRHDLNAHTYLSLTPQTLKDAAITRNQETDQLRVESLSNLFSNSTSNEVYKKVLQTVQELNGDPRNEVRISTSKRSKRSLADTLRYSTEEKDSYESKATVKTVEVLNENDNPSVHPKSRQRSRKGKNNKNPRRNRKKSGKKRKLPFWWTRHGSRLRDEEENNMCRRKSLTVDFSQLGWDDLIISPKSFNAHYCEGSCSFSMIKHTETSNHAAIQSLIHAMKINPDIPTPCCVPSETSPLTLLYFDEHGSLVMKSYPDMIVNKCGCR